MHLYFRKITNCILSIFTQIYSFFFILKWSCTTILCYSHVSLNKQIIFVHELCIWPKGKTSELCLGLWLISHFFHRSFFPFCQLVFISSIWYSTSLLTCCVTWNIISVTGETFVNIQWAHWVKHLLGLWQMIVLYAGKFRYDSFSNYLDVLNMIKHTYNVTLTNV